MAAFTLRWCRQLPAARRGPRGAVKVTRAAPGRSRGESRWLWGLGRVLLGAHSAMVRGHGEMAPFCPLKNKPSFIEPA